MLCLELFGSRIKVVRQFVPEHDSLRDSAEHRLLCGVHCGCAGSDVGISRKLGKISLGAVFSWSDVRRDTDEILVAVSFRTCLRQRRHGIHIPKHLKTKQGTENSAPRFNSVKCDLQFSCSRWCRRSWRTCSSCRWGSSTCRSCCRWVRWRPWCAR